MSRAPSSTATTRPGPDEAALEHADHVRGQAAADHPDPRQDLEHVEAVMDERGRAGLVGEPRPLARRGPGPEPVHRGRRTSRVGPTSREQPVAEPVGLDDARVERIGDVVLGRDQLEVRPGALEALGDPPQLRDRGGRIAPVRAASRRTPGRTGRAGSAGRRTGRTAAGPGIAAPRAPGRGGATSGPIMRATSVGRGTGTRPGRHRDRDGEQDQAGSRPSAPAAGRSGATRGRR